MTLDEIFSRPYYRRLAIALLVALILLLAAIRYSFLPFLEPGLSQTYLQGFAKFLEDLSTSFVVTLVISLLVLLLTPRSTFSAKILVLDASELKREFTDALSRSDFWWFNGGCGRYFRSSVLSTMDQRATAESAGKTLRAVILNPGNPILCSQHALYRAATSQGRRDGNWTDSRVKCELVATIILCLRTGQRNGLLNITVYLSDRFSTFRADISSVSAIETREDPKAPALKSHADSDFYNALKTEFDILANQSYQVSDTTRVAMNVNDRATLEHAIQTLAIPGLIVEPGEFAQILSLIKKPINPHA